MKTDHIVKSKWKKVDLICVMDETYWNSSKSLVWNHGKKITKTISQVSV